MPGALTQAFSGILMRFSVQLARLAGLRATFGRVLAHPVADEVRFLAAKKGITATACIET